MLNLPSYLILNAQQKYELLYDPAEPGSDCSVICHVVRDQADIYKIRAAEIFQVHPDQVTSEQRRFAKVGMHSQIYSAS